jgi:hypothetical protein
MRVEVEKRTRRTRSRAAGVATLTASRKAIAFIARGNQAMQQAIKQNLIQNSYSASRRPIRGEKLIDVLWQHIYTQAVEQTHTTVKHTNKGVYDCNEVQEELAFGTLVLFAQCRTKVFNGRILVLLLSPILMFAIIYYTCGADNNKCTPVCISKFFFCTTVINAALIRRCMDQIHIYKLSN